MRNACCRCARHAWSALALGVLFMGTPAALAQTTHARAQAALVLSPIPLVTIGDGVNSQGRFNGSDEQPFLSDEAEALLKKKAEITFLEFHDALIVKWFGLLIEKHYKQICLALRGQGKITYDGKRRPKDDTLIRYIG